MRETIEMDNIKKNHPTSGHQDGMMYELARDKIYTNFKNRLRLDSIDTYSQQRIRNFLPTIELSMGEVIGSFYAHMTSFDQTKKYFHNRDVNILKSKQVQHWMRLFSGDLDKNYVSSAVRVGFIHHRVGLPLFLYLSGYNRVLCDLTSLAIRHHAGTMDSSETVSSIIKLVSLDMDITISCYFLAEKLNVSVEIASD